MEIILIRHGITASNQKKIYPTANEPLSEEGRAKIQKNIDKYHEFHYDAIITSPFLRAKETAELIRDGRDIPIFEEPLLQELSMGVLEGHSFDEIYSTRRELIQDWMDNPYEYKPMGGESIHEGMIRAKKFIEGIDENKKVIFITHDAFIRLCLSVVLESPEAFFKFSIDNGSINRIEVREHYAFITTING